VTTTCTESCTGSKLTLCYGGQPYTVDCGSYGFTSCDDTSFTITTPSGASVPYASCIP
jgi:hypothetical protein